MPRPPKSKTQSPAGPNASNECRADNSELSTFYFFREGQPRGCLSNFSDDGITVNGLYYPTTEHFFQSLKFIEPTIAQQVRAQERPIQAFYEGRKNRRYLRQDWEQVKDDVMRFAVMTKALTHAHVREEILATGEAELVEKNEKDGYWGCGKNGDGKNMLGQIWMEVRASLRGAEDLPTPEDYLERAKSKFLYSN